MALGLSVLFFLVKEERPARLMPRATKQTYRPSFATLTGRLALLSFAIVALWLVVGHTYSIPFGPGYAAPLVVVLVVLNAMTYLCFTRYALRRITVDENGIEVETRRGDVRSMAWADLDSFTHRDRLGVWFRWKLRSGDGREIEILEMGLSTIAWRGLFSWIDDHAPHPQLDLPPDAPDRLR